MTGVGNRLPGTFKSATTLQIVGSGTDFSRRDLLLHYVFFQTSDEGYYLRDFFAGLISIQRDLRNLWTQLLRYISPVGAGTPSFGSSVIAKTLALSASAGTWSLSIPVPVASVVNTLPGMGRSPAIYQSW